MLLVGVFFLFLISNSFAVQNTNEVCSILSICDNVALIRSQVVAIREEQERQANILEGSARSLESAKELKELITKNNKEVCSIQSICNNLAAISSELDAVRAEQERQADLLEESCKTGTDSVPENCYEALNESQKSGVTEILVPDYSENPFKVACDQESHGGGWTIILRRTDGSEDFFREWNDYEKGFGQANSEYFVGLAKLHALTSSVPQELLVIVEDADGERFEIYDNFKVGGEANNYTLESVGSFYGTAGDGLGYHLGMQFSTKDRDNDEALNLNCAEVIQGAWWYRNCYSSNLAGIYWPSGPLRWNYPKFRNTLETAIMLIRPRTDALKV